MKRRPTPDQIARGLVVSLIQWETGSADGESYSAARAVYGSKVIQDAMEKIQRDLVRRGAAWLSDEQIQAASRG